MIDKRILKTIAENNLIDENQHIVIGLSGGPDSVCLFNVLLTHSKENNWTIHPVHINHQLRPGDAEADQEYVENLCKSKGLKCESFVYDCNKIAKDEKITSEEAGRNLRYGAFAQVAASLMEEGILKEDIKIAVAHNADDQAETILFRIMRGTGVDGIAGMRYKRTDQWGTEIVRPLLDCFKADILKYCEENELKPCIDKTNEEALYTRNKIRLNLIPEIEKNFNSNFKESLIRLGKAAAMNKDFISKSAMALYEDAIIDEDLNHVTFSGEILRQTHEAVRQQVVSRALINLGLDEDVTFSHFQQASSIIDNEKPSARLDLPKGFYITKIYDDVKIAREFSRNDCAEIKTNRVSLAEFKKLELDKDRYCAFDLAKLEESFGDDFDTKVMLRNRQAGDFISIDENKRKKLQDYLVDRKLPKDLRDKVKMVAIGSEILWILPGFDKGRYSGKYKLSNATKIVFFVEILSAV